MMWPFQTSGNSHLRTSITSCPTRITWACFLKKWPFLVSRWATLHRPSATWLVLALQSIWEEVDESANRVISLSGNNDRLTIILLFLNPKICLMQFYNFLLTDRKKIQLCAFLSNTPYICRQCRQCSKYRSSA